MKGIVVEDVKRLAVKDFPTPKATDGHVIIKITYCGICGSDRNFWDSAWIKEVILGHEFVGTISDPGKSSFKEGDRVVAIGINPCGACESCRRSMPHLCLAGGLSTLGVGVNGGYAEYVEVREENVRKIPDTISDIEAALIEPAAVALHALKVSGVNQHSRILITGAGAIGLTLAACAKALGAEFVSTTARNPKRIEASKNRPYIDYAFDGKDPKLKDTILEIAGNITHVFECSGADALFSLAAEVVAPAGKIVIVGQPSNDMHFPGMSLFMKEAAVYTSYIFVPEDFDEVISLMHEGKLAIADLATSIVGFGKAQEMFELLGSGASTEIKVLLDPAK